MDNLDVQDGNVGVADWCHLLLCLLLMVTATLCKEQGITVVGVCCLYELFIVQRSTGYMMENKRDRAAKDNGKNLVERKATRRTLTAIIFHFGCRPPRSKHDAAREDVSDTRRRDSRRPRHRCRPRAGRSCLRHVAERPDAARRGVTIHHAESLHQYPEKRNVYVRFDNPAAAAEFPARHLTYAFLLPLNAWLLLFPWHLCCDWTMGTVLLVESVADPRNLATLAFLLVLGAMVWQGAFSPDPPAPPLLMGLALLVLPFLPASNVFFPVGFVVAERVLYSPSMGFCLLVAYGAQLLGERLGSLQRYLLPWAFLLLLSLHALRTFVRNWDWESEHTIFMAGLKVNQNNAKLYNNVGHALESQGQFEQALEYFLKASEVQPDDMGAHINVGRTYNNLQRYEEAEAAFRRAKSLLPHPRPGEPYHSRMAPNHLNVFLNLANLISRNNTRLEEADARRIFSPHPHGSSVQLYRQAISMRADYIEAYINRGDILIKLNRTYRLTCTIILGGLGQPVVIMNGVVCRTREAQNVYERALQFDKVNPDIYYNVASLDELGHLDPRERQSRTEAGGLRQLREDFRSALFNLALLLSDLRRPLEAVPFLRQLLQVSGPHTLVFSHLTVCNHINGYIEIHHLGPRLVLCYNHVLITVKTIVSLNFNLIMSSVSVTASPGPHKGPHPAGGHPGEPHQGPGLSPGGLGSEVHLDEDIQDILEYLYDSGSEIDDEVKDPDYENSASDELEFEEEEREEIPAKRPRLEVAPVRMLTTCRDTSTAAAGSNVAAGTWRKDDPSPPTPPPFTARPGLNLVGDVSSPFDAFSLFFTENIFKSIKEETNRYARSIIDRESKKGPLKPHGMLAKWKAVSVAQIKLFFCVIIHMSLVKKPGMKDYWSTHGFLKNAFCQSINMPRTLFMRILSMLHLNDNSKYIEYGKPGHDRLFKIRPVLESLIYSFGNAYTPQQNLTIDEAMCPFRGCVGFRVYIKGKPHKYGIKIFQICEAVSGYAYNLDIYTGKDPEQPEHNSIPNLVDRLAKRFYGQGYHIYFDRWFSSPELFDKLWEKKTLAVGTVMPSRKTMPKTEFSQKLKRGEIIKMRRKHLLAIKWKDVRDVFMLSTVHEGKMMPVKPKTPTREELFKPDAVIDYNKGKVGVDRSDQMMAYYSFSRKTLKWWKKIFFHLFSLCFVIGNIIYNKANPDKKISLKDFYLAVGGELLNQASIEHSEKETTSKTDVARLLGKHYCYKIAPESGKAVQRRCKVCADSAKHKTGKAARKDTRFECKQCKIPLCV
ncbi:TMTC3, partial [Cordylochernes scorpioides]